MKLLEGSGAVRPIYGSLGVKRLRGPLARILKREVISVKMKKNLTWKDFVFIYVITHTFFGRTEKNHENVPSEWVHFAAITQRNVLKLRHNPHVFWKDWEKPWKRPSRIFWLCSDYTKKRP